MSGDNETNSVYERPNHFAALNNIRQEDEIYGDVTIKVNSKEFRVHKFILAAAINYFRRMFTSDFQERKKDVILFEHVDEANMEAIITFCYTGRIIFTKENAVNLIEDTNFFELIDVKDKCIEYLKSNIDVDNVCEVSSLANLLPRCSSLLKLSESFIIKNLKEVLLTNQYTSLDFELLKNILSKIDLEISSELTVEAIVKWASDNVDGKKAHLLELLEYVNPFDLKVSSLVHNLFKDELKDKVGSKHREFVGDVLSVFSGKIKIENISEKLKSYIVVGNAGYQTEIYDPTTKKWNYGNVNFSCRLHSYFMYKDKLYDFESCIGNSKASTMCIYNVYSIFEDIKAIYIKIHVPFHSDGITAAGLDDFLYACNFDMPDIWRFSLKSRTWQRVCKMIYPLLDCKLIVVQSYLYAVGIDPTNRRLIMMEAYNPRTNKWSIITRLDSTNDACIEFCVTELNNKIYICEEYCSCSNLPWMKAFDLETKIWTEMTSMKTARRYSTFLAYEGKIWAIGGLDSNNYCSSSVEIYDPASDSWSYGTPLNQKMHSAQGFVFSTKI